MYRILVSDPLESTGLELLRQSGHEVHLLDKKDKATLPDIVGDFDALVVRSGTQVTRDILEAGVPRLRVVGRAGIGVDNVDVPAATELGILVVNAPTANLLSATEHTFALLLALARNVAAADRSMKEGTWDRKAFVGAELQGKTIGIIGFGRIGQRVARRAQAFEMTVLAYDPFLDDEVVQRHDATPRPLDALLAEADVVTLHVPLTDDTRGLLNAERIGLLRPDALLVNCARGGVVDEVALLDALENGRLAGAGVDVFAEEPPTDWRLAQHPRVVATPHLGAQTQEAQIRISTQTARMVLAALAGSLSVTAVNLPFRPSGTAGEPYLRLAEKLGTLAAGLLPGPASAVDRIDVGLQGLESTVEHPVAVAALKGVLARFLGDGVNYVNAERVARERGLKVVRSVHAEPADYPHLVTVRVRTASGADLSIQGALFHGKDPRIVGIGDYQLEFRPKGWLMVARNRDVPGVVGRLGTALGDAGVNIAEIHLSRRPGSREALAVLRLDQSPPAEVVAGLRALEEMESILLVDLKA